MASFKRVILCLTLLASTTVFCAEQIKPLFNAQQINNPGTAALKKLRKAIRECCSIAQLELTSILFVNDQSHPLMSIIKERREILEQQAAQQDLSSSFICLVNNQQQTKKSQATKAAQLKALLAQMKQEEETVAANKKAAADKVAQLEASAQNRATVIAQHEIREQLLLAELTALQNDKALRRKSLEDIQKKLTAATKAYDAMNQEHEEDDSLLTILNSASK